MTEINHKNSCYCVLWEKDPSLFEKKRVPKGFCGLCQSCGKPGHLRQHPGVLSYTGSWCDFHYKVLSLIHPLTPLGFILWSSVALGVAYAAIKVFGK